MRISSLEKLASKGVVIIQGKGNRWQVECVRKDENGFLTDRLSEWGIELYTVIRDLLNKVTLAE
jgi:hypothetical protein